MTKKWFHSKTLWINILAGVAIIIQAATGEQWLPAETQVGILAVLNLFLRIITKQGLEK